MIRVTVELFPFGDETQKKTLTVFDIANDGSGDSMRGSYKARKSPTSPWIEKVVTNYPRQAYNVRRLVYEVLKVLEKRKD